MIVLSILALSPVRPITTAVQAGALRDDVRHIGLPFLYEALSAVANCPDLHVDTRRFANASALYHLHPEDLTFHGRFADELANLDAGLRRRIRDDRQAFCSSARLKYVVDHGILDVATPRANGS